MKKLFPLLALLLLFAPSYASHLVGGDVEYQLTGTKQWKIRLTLYRDCNGVDLCYGPCGAPCSVSMAARPAYNSRIAPFTNIGCTPSSYNVPLTLNLVKVEDAEQQVTALCPSRKNGCNNMGCTVPGSFTPSVEKYIFEGTLNLNNPLFPVSCQYWEVYFGTCCRNDIISTLQAPGGTGFGISTIINIGEGTTLADNKSNSPKLGNEPFIVICGGQEYYYNMGATDPDGDSLSYSLDTARTDIGSAVTYAPPFSATSPLPYNPLASITLPPHQGFVCDPVTGSINFMPISTGANPVVGVITMQIKQWRRVAGRAPVLVGITQRDIQTWIVSCPVNNTVKVETVPISGIANGRSEWVVEAGDSLWFDMIATDIDSTDSTTLKPDMAAIQAITGASLVPAYSSGKPQHDRYRFGWRPTIAQASSTPYHFSVMAYDNKCPVPSRIAQDFQVLVVDYTIAISSIEKQRTSCFMYDLNAVTTGPIGNASEVIWMISTKANQLNLDSNYVMLHGQNISSVTFPGPGKYLILTWIEKPGKPAVNVFDTLVVTLPEIGPISGNLNPAAQSTETYSVSNPSSYNIQWIVDGEDNVINTSNTEAEIKWGATGTGQVKVIATDSFLCESSDSISIHIQQSVGVKEPAVFRNLQLFPNPVQSVINITSPAQSSEPMTIRLFDVTGKTVMEKVITAENGKYDAVLNVNHLNNGTYFISISIGTQQMQRKVSINK